MQGQHSEWGRIQQQSNKYLTSKFPTNKCPKVTMHSYLRLFRGHVEWIMIPLIVDEEVDCMFST